MLVFAGVNDPSLSYIGQLGVYLPDPAEDIVFADRLEGPLTITP